MRILLFSLVVLLAGCASDPGATSYESKQVRKLPAATLTQLAEDVTAYLKNEYKPATDKFLLNVPTYWKSDGTAPNTKQAEKVIFGEQFITLLRTAGYAVATSPQNEPDAVHITYWIETSGTELLFRMQIPGKGTWAKLYAMDKYGNLTPLSSPSNLAPLTSQKGV